MYVRSGRARLCWRPSGEGPGTDVLMIHAGVTDQRSWEGLRQALSQGHRCVSFDQRGYGDSTWEVEDGWSQSGDVLAVCRAAGLSKPVLLAASMGSNAALDLALSDPDSFSALVLIGPGVFDAPHGPPTAAEVELFRRIDEAEGQDALEEVNRLECQLWLDGPEVEEGRVGGSERELFMEMNGAALAASETGEPAQGPLWNRVKEISLPTLIAFGELDLTHLKQQALALSRSIAGASVIELPGRAHLPQMEHDQLLDARVVDFVDRLSQS